MLYPLLDEIIFLQKMKLADLTALDGVISHIRIWKLGSLEHKIFPTDAAISKLSNILLNHVAGGAMDFIWGPDLELAETSTDVAKFLGSEKYEFVMNTIHAGLGVPAAVGRTKGSMSDNFMSLRVLMERLNYGRRIITRFWEGEIKLVQRAMGFKTPAKIMYDTMNLNDEVAEKALWIRLLEENVVPVSAVQERFGRIPEIDNALMAREQKMRAKGQIPEKAGPYHDGQPKLSLTKIFAQRGAITPSELKPPYDIALKEPTEDHADQLESTFPDQIALKKAGPPRITPGKKKPAGKSGQGRPKKSKDSTTRKKRIPKPSSKAADNFMECLLYANKAQKVIGETLNPFFLDKFGRANLRQLTEKESVELERFKLHALYSMPYGEELCEASVVELMDNMEDCAAEEEGYKTVCQELRNKSDTDLTYEQLFNVRSYIYALTALAEEEEIEGDDE
jgi:hypothetical protein